MVGDRQQDGLLGEVQADLRVAGIAELEGADLLQLGQVPGEAVGVKAEAGSQHGQGEGRRLPAIGGQAAQLDPGEEAGGGEPGVEEEFGGEVDAGGGRRG